MEIIIVVSFWVILLVAGTKIATNKGMKASTGFWWAFFLGPLGLLIVALLNPPPTALYNAAPFVPERPPCSPDLSLDAYRLWLASKYNIVKNDLFEKFVINGQTYSSLNEAIIYAHSLENDLLQKSIEQKNQHEIKIKNNELKNQRKIVFFEKNLLHPIILILISIFSYFSYNMWQDSRENQEYLRQDKSAIGKVKSKFERELSHFGFKIHPNTVFRIQSANPDFSSKFYVDPDRYTQIALSDNFPEIEFVRHSKSDEFSLCQYASPYRKPYLGGFIDNIHMIKADGKSVTFPVMGYAFEVEDFFVKQAKQNGFSTDISKTSKEANEDILFRDNEFIRFSVKSKDDSYYENLPEGVVQMQICLGKINN